MNRLILSLFLAVSIFDFSGFAFELEKCRKIYFKKGHPVEIQSSLHQGTHIILQDNIVGHPMIDNHLWKAVSSLNHIMIQAHSYDKNGEKASLTVTTDSGETIQFYLRRVDTKSDHCVIIEKSANVQTFKIAPPQDKVGLQRVVAELQKELNNQKAMCEKRIEEALRSYRPYIYTRYHWVNKRGYKGIKIVSDVYDDGRFTFLRLEESGQKEIAIIVEIEGEKEMIDYIIDSQNVYMIAGIYEKIIVKYGPTTVTVKRDENPM